MKKRSLLLLNSVGILSQMMTFSFGLGIAVDLLVSIHRILFPYIALSLSDTGIFKVRTVFAGW